ncbi:hypothetical protein [Pseudophaeobacter leonis]|uniref:hypothetical protein n=1 Tax=Pseudophaeobacter leonis TaxID=1144477 RepID=UPI0009F23631|nr:hypothetical protein [Pseudophaeobacter leonis]
MVIDDLNQIERNLDSAWIADGASPFIADLVVSNDIFDSARRVARQYPITMLLHRFPTLGVWAVLYPLSKNYEAASREVYPHLEDFFGKPICAGDKDLLKSRFRKAARHIGIPVPSGNHPTQVFFSPLGVPEPQHDRLARAFLRTATYKGPPAIEDTVASRNWQRIAVVEYCPSQKRLYETIVFDESAHYARRFDAWRRGEPGQGKGERTLFKAYDDQASLMGRKKSDFVGPPSLIWQRDRLGLAAEISAKRQVIACGAFPTQIASGKRITINPPWPETVEWTSGSMSVDVPFAPTALEVLLFDADSGALLQRIAPKDQLVEVPASRLVALSKVYFQSPSFGSAISTADPEIFSAWIECGETLCFEGRADLKISRPVDTSIWFDGSVLGRNGSTALYANDLNILMCLDPDVGGPTRIVRATIEGVARFVSINVDENNQAAVAFTAFGFQAEIDPGRAAFEVLVPGAAGDPNARADLKAQCWVWPGVPPQSGDLTFAPVPSNYDQARSAGLHVDSYGRLSVNEHSDIETPILGLKQTDRSLEFDLVARSEKLWQQRVDRGHRVYVPKGDTLQFGYDNRHDTLLLRCFDRDADLIVLVALIKRPFIQRQTFEIGAEKLELDTGDDRIAIRRADGHVESLTRLRRVNDTGALKVKEKENLITFSIRPNEDVEGLRVALQPVSGELVEGDYQLGHMPASKPVIPGISVEQNSVDQMTSVEIQAAKLTRPARLLFSSLDEQGVASIIRDASFAPVAIGLSGVIANPSRADLAKLANFLAEPEAEGLGGQLSRTLYPSYRSAFDTIGSNRTIGSVKPALNVVRGDGGTARHDIVGVAPWVFEAPLPALTGFLEGTGLSSLDQMHVIPAPEPRPDLRVQDPLAAWLSRVNSEHDLPKSLDGEALQHAFRALRFRMQERDMKDLRDDGPIGNAARIICSAHSEKIDELRAL